MKRFRPNKILVPFDFSTASENAIEYAAFVAKCTKGELILMHVQKLNALLFDKAITNINLKGFSEITEILKQRLQQIAANLKRKHRVRVTCIVSDGNIISELDNMARAANVGFVVMGTHGKDSTNDLFLGSNSYRFLTRSTVPTMMVQANLDGLCFGKIVIPVDTASYSINKISIAVQLAKLVGAELFVIGLVQNDEIDERHKLEVNLDTIKKISREKGLACTVEFAESKNYAKEILDYTKKTGGNLIITVADHNTEFTHVILDTCIHQILNESDVPVLCIPPESLKQDYNPRQLFSNAMHTSPSLLSN